MLAAKATSTSSDVNRRPAASSYAAMKASELASGASVGVSVLANAPAAAPTTAASGSAARLSQSWIVWIVWPSQRKFCASQSACPMTRGCVVRLSRVWMRHWICSSHCGRTAPVLICCASTTSCRGQAPEPECSHWTQTGLGITWCGGKPTEAVTRTTAARICAGLGCVLGSVFPAHAPAGAPLFGVNRVAVALDPAGQWCSAGEARLCGTLLHLDAGVGAAATAGARLHDDLSAIVEEDS